MKKVYIGIDPGSKGFISFLYPDGRWSHISISEHTTSELYNKLSSDIKMIINEGYSPFIIMEEVHAIFGSSAKATFSFGEIFGMLRGFIISLCVPSQLIQPKDWQKEIWINSDKVYKSGKSIDTKATSINSATRLFPSADLRRTESCKNVDDNKVDSMLIAEYARRKNL